MINSENFYIASAAFFKQVAEAPTKNPDFANSTSQYWYEDGLLYRRSDHWGKVFACKWPISINIEGIGFRSTPKGIAMQAYEIETGEAVFLVGSVPFAEMRWLTREEIHLPIHKIIEFFEKQKNPLACHEIKNRYG